MKRYFILFTTIVLLAGVGPACKKGCTDYKALNVDYSADKNDGSCNYSNVVFYSSIGYINGIAITGIDVAVNQVNVGTITSVYPTGPGNCSAQGLVTYQFSNGNSVDWNTIIHLANGSMLYTGGVASPSSVYDCIKVNVTP